MRMLLACMPLQAPCMMSTCRCSTAGVAVLGASSYGVQSSLSYKRVAPHAHRWGAHALL